VRNKQLTDEQENMMKKEFCLTEEQFKELIEACKPIPLIALNCGMPPSPQEMANAAWKRWGDEMGFDYMTVEPCTGMGPRYFMAEPI